MIAGLVACAALLRLQAAPATWQFQQGPNHLQILHQARPLLLYVFTNTQFKPYVKELCTLQGTNVLLDAPADHLHHHGLMLAFKVNDINFWEESPTAGVQVAIAWPGPAKDRCVAFIDQRGEAVLAQRLAWLPQAHRHDPDPRPAALLTEERILRLRVHPELQEVSLEWHSTFTTGSTTNVFRISGAGYHGLGLRPLPSFNRVARRLNPIGAAYSPEARWDVVGGEWGALVGPVNGGEITLTLFNHPLNTAPPMFFSMLNAFAYLSATQALDQQPQTYRAGESFTLRYLVTLHQGARTVDFLNSRAFLKAAPRN
ncbi:MAG: PmoA family protein [Verrucomicrobiae bacterium]|nr:PmoA family protein [Verrucomicrobiae bacterium]